MNAAGDAKRRSDFQPSVAIFAILRLPIGPVTNDSATEHNLMTAPPTLRLADAADAPGDEDDLSAN